MQLSGIDIDMAHELGKDLGAKPEFVDSSFAKLIDDLSTDRCDIAMFGVGMTPARQEKLRFSPPYLASRSSWWKHLRIRCARVSSA